MIYEPRKYRDFMGEGRFNSFSLMVEETDLWIGLGRSVINSEERKIIENYIINQRAELKEYNLKHPLFYKSHQPLEILSNDPASVVMMKKAAAEAGTGPMAAVAGFFAMKCLEILEQFYPDEEIIVENGGDIYSKLSHKIVINPFQERSEYFKGLVLEIYSVDKYISVCSSSGMFGHSFSYGKADLVTVISQDPCLADAWATSLANKVKLSEDIEKICKELPPGIDAVLAIKEDRMGYKGKYPFLRF